jgi:hypothetical protein
MGKKQLILSVFGVVIFIVTILTVSFFPERNKTVSAPETNQAISIPSKIGSYSLTMKLEGDEAMQQISQLHGKDIDIKAGYIIEYQNDDQAPAMVWISESSDENEATKLFNKMNKLMDQSKMYSDHRTVKIDGTSVEYVFGMDMDNYYYQKGSQVIWITVSMDENQEFIKSGLKEF